VRPGTVAWKVTPAPGEMIIGSPAFGPDNHIYNEQGLVGRGESWVADDRKRRVRVAVECSGGALLHLGKAGPRVDPGAALDNVAADIGVGNLAAILDDIKPAGRGGVDIQEDVLPPWPAQTFGEAVLQPPSTPKS
jgi:hypothetical protein